METTQQPPKNKIRNNLPQFLVFLIIISVFVFGSSLLSKFINNDNNKEEIENIVQDAIEDQILLTRPKCESTFEEYKSLEKNGQVLSILENHKSSASNGYFINDVYRTVLISGKSDISCGYLYLRANANKKALDEKYHSIYVNPQDFGGHILRNKGIMINNTSDYTEALIPLNTVAYLAHTPYNPDAKDFRIADWAKLLNVNSHLTFHLGLSADNVDGEIEEISIGYKCWNTDTGEETKDCLLSLQE